MSKEKKTKTKNEEQKPEAGAVPPQEQQGPMINILSQYIRDLSFENPDVIKFRQANGLPEMDIQIGMDARKIPDPNADNIFETALNIRAEAKQGEDTVFIAELQYGAIVALDPKIPEENHHPILLIEVPRLLFPFAREILSSITIKGGYPPLLLTPVDFHQLYMNQFGEQIEAAQKEAEAAAKKSEKAD